MAPVPTLVVVSGPPGSGKTTLAHQLARAVGCPAICRDEIKEGMAHATPGFAAAPDGELTLRTLPVFFGVLELLLRAGVTVVAGAAFQDRIWRPQLEPLRSLARFRIVHCTVTAEVAARRTVQRGRAGRAHYGLRRGEVLGLHWSALDWKAGTVMVTHGVKRIKARDATSPYRTQLVIAELKTPRSRRTLALTAELRAALRQHHARQAEARIAAGALWRDHGLTFTTQIGTPIDLESYALPFPGCARRRGSATGTRMSCVIPGRR